MSKKGNECNSKNLENCKDKDEKIVKSRFLLKSALIVVIGGLVIGYSLVFANQINELISKFLGDFGGIIFGVFISFGLLLLFTYLLIKLEGSKKEDEAIIKGKKWEF